MVRFEELSEDDLKELFAQMNVIELTKTIYTEFKKLLDQIYGSLKKRVPHDRVVLTLTKDATMLFADDNHKLDEAKNMFEVFKAILPHCSYYYFDVLKLLVNVHGTLEDKKCLDGYLKSFTSYCRAMLYKEFCGSDDSRPNRTKIKFKLNFDRLRLKTDYVKDNIISNIARILKIKPSSLYLHRIREGCVCEFWISSFLFGGLFPLSDDQMVALYREVNVTSIQCDQPSLSVVSSFDAWAVKYEVKSWPGFSLSIGHRKLC